MKKLFLTIALVITMGLGASAQYDTFFRWNGDEDFRYDDGDWSFILPQAHGTGIDYDAPVGSGLLVLTALGGAYALARNRKN